MHKASTVIIIIIIITTRCYAEHGYEIACRLSERLSIRPSVTCKISQTVQDHYYYGLIGSHIHPFDWCQIQ